MSRRKPAPDLIRGWTPVRRQGHAPTRESGAHPDSAGTGRALVTVVHGGRRTGGSADRFDGELDVDRAGLLEGQRALDPLALLQRLLEIDHHQVEAAGLEL